MASMLRGEAPRAAASAPQPRASLLQIPPYVAGRSKVAGFARVIKLSSNESALGASPQAIEAVRAGAAGMFRYPDSSVAELRAALAAAHGIPAEHIVCGDGSDELLHLLGQAYASPGDEVLYSQHGFVVYPMVALAAGAVPVASAERACVVDVEAMLAKVTPRTRIVFVANPNSTGSYLPERDVVRLHAGLPPHVLLVLDAAYAEFAEMPDYEPGVRLVNKHANVVMTRTFSKAYGLAGLRLGWAYCPPAIADVLNRLRAPFNVTLPAQQAGVAAVKDTAFLDRVRAHNRRWRPWLEGELKNLGLLPVPSAANFVLTQFPGGVAQADAVNAFLTQRGILVRDMKAYGLGDCLRITVGLEDELKALVQALAEFLPNQ